MSAQLPTFRSAAPRAPRPREARLPPDAGRNITQLIPIDMGSRLHLGRPLEQLQRMQGPSDTPEHPPAALGVGRNCKLYIWQSDAADFAWWPWCARCRQLRACGSLYDNCIVCNEGSSYATIHTCWQEGLLSPLFAAHTAGSRKDAVPGDGSEARGHCRPCQ